MANKINWNMDELHHGCILASIAHAIMVAHYPLLANEHSWDGINYSILDNAGRQGTVTFVNSKCVGAFKNDRLDFLIDGTTYFSYAPDDMNELAKAEALQYLLMDVGEGEEEMVPYMTTGFWGDKKELATLHSFEDFMEYGGDLLRIQALDIEDAMEEWEDEYSMDDEQVALMKLVFERKIAAGDDEIIITKEDAKMIGTPKNEKGREECITSFKEMNITIEF